MDVRQSELARRAVAGKRRSGARSVAALALAASLLTFASAHAQEGAVVVEPVPVAPAPSAKPNAVPLDENTARLIGARRLKIGVFAFDYGVTDWFSFGIDPPEFVLKAVSSVLVPNLHVKFAFLHLPGVEVSGMAAGYWAHISTDVAAGELVIVPLTLYVSTRLASNLWLHLEGAYNWSRGFGSGDVSKSNIGGVVAMRTAQVGAMFELRLSRVVALIARGRYQFHETPIVFQGNGMVDPYTHVEASIEATPLKEHPAMGIGGVALTWKHVGVVAGAGYGHYFIPGNNLALPYKGAVPEAELWALF